MVSLRRRPPLGEGYDRLLDRPWGLMPESAGSYVSKNKYMISLYIFRYLFLGLAEKTVSRMYFFQWVRILSV